MSYYPWDVLNIESTTNKKLIKKAYALLLRENKPDEDPEGFILINDAYNEAIRQASDSKPGFYESRVYQTSVEDELDEDTSSDDGTDESLIDWEDIDLDVIEPLSPEVFEQVEQDSWDDTDTDDDIDYPPPPPPFSTHQSLSEELEDILDQDENKPLSDDEVSELLLGDNEEDSDRISDIYHLISTDNYKPDSWRKVLESPEFILNKEARNEASSIVFDFVLDGIEYDLNHSPKFCFEEDKFLVISAGLPLMEDWKPYTEVNLPLLMLFENTFGWTQDWQSLEFQFGRRTFEITDLLEEKKHELSKKAYSYKPPDAGTKIIGYSHLCVDTWQLITTHDWHRYSEWAKGLIWPLIGLAVFIAIKVLIVMS